MINDMIGKGVTSKSKSKSKPFKSVASPTAAPPFCLVESLLSDDAVDVDVLPIATGRLAPV
jgi:hypothetical protein